LLFYEDKIRSAKKKVWAILHYTFCGQVEEVRLKNQDSKEKRKGGGEAQHLKGATNECGRKEGRKEMNIKLG
jgi:hypothetical protein